MANWACKAVPRVFQPQPERTTLRNHSWATQTAARRKARRRLFVECNQGDRLGVDSLATASCRVVGRRGDRRWEPVEGKGCPSGGCVQRFSGLGGRNAGRSKP